MDDAVASQDISCHNISIITIVLITTVRHLNLHTTIVIDVHAQGGGTSQGSGQLLAVSQLGGTQGTRRDHVV
jgi:hypothetical protein